MVGDISDIYVNSFQKMMSDPNYSIEELNAIATGYAKLLEESSGVLNELKDVVNVTISIIHMDNINSESVVLNIGMKKLRSGIFNGMQVNFWGITAEEWSY